MTLRLVLSLLCAAALAGCATFKHPPPRDWTVLIYDDSSDAKDGFFLRDVSVLVKRGEKWREEAIPRRNKQERIMVHIYDGTTGATYLPGKERRKLMSKGFFPLLNSFYEAANGKNASHRDGMQTVRAHYNGDNATFRFDANGLLREVYWGDEFKTRTIVIPIADLTLDERIFDPSASAPLFADLLLKTEPTQPPPTAPISSAPTHQH